MVNFELSSEQRQFRSLAREFAENEIAPRAAYHDRTGEFPKEICQMAWELGLMNLQIPSEFGGAGLGCLCPFGWVVKA